MNSTLFHREARSLWSQVGKIACSSLRWRGRSLRLAMGVAGDNGDAREVPDPYRGGIARARSNEVQPDVMRSQSHCFSSMSFGADFGPVLDGGWVAETLADAACLACMSPVRDFGEKAGTT